MYLAVAKVESQGKGGYRAIGVQTGSGNRAYGKCQIMDYNIPNWTEEVLWRVMTPQEFLDDQVAQDLVCQYKLMQLLATHTPQDTASIWFTGGTLYQNGHRQDANGMTGFAYAEKVFNHYISLVQ